MLTVSLNRFLIFFFNFSSAFTVKTDTKSKAGPLSKLLGQVDDYPVIDQGLVRSMVPPMSQKEVTKIKLKMFKKLPNYLSTSFTPYSIYTVQTISETLNKLFLQN